MKLTISRSTKQIKEYIFRGERYDTKKDAIEARKEYLFEQKQKHCKHKRIKTKTKGVTECLGYEEYKRYTAYVRYCLDCKSELSTEPIESERWRFQ